MPARSRSAAAYALSESSPAMRREISAGRSGTRRRIVWRLDSVTGASHPAVVGVLEPGEDRGEELGTVDRLAELDVQRRRLPLHARGQLVRRLVCVDADPEDDTTVTRLGQDPSHLLSLDEHVVRELD